jgi:hypothetical protein
MSVSGCGSVDQDFSQLLSVPVDARCLVGNRPAPGFAGAFAGLAVATASLPKNEITSTTLWT